MYLEVLTEHEQKERRTKFVRSLLRKYPSNDEGTDSVFIDTSKCILLSIQSN